MKWALILGAALILIAGGGLVLRDWMGMGVTEAASVGDVAPSFTADSTRGPLNLADYLGQKNVVLAFYFRDFTPV